MMQSIPANYLIGIIASLGTAVLFAITNVFYKKLDDRVSTLEIVATRAWVSLPFAAIFVLPLFNADGFVMTTEALLIHAFSMFVGIVIGDVLYFMSQSRIGVSRALPITASYPLMVYILAAVFVDELVLPSRVLGIFMVVGGVGLIAYDQNRQSQDVIDTDRRNILLGFAFALLTIVAWALSDVALQVGLVDIDPLDANFVRMALGSTFLLPALPYSKKRGTSLRNPKLLSTMLLLGILGYGLPMLLMTYAVDIVGATVNSVMLAAAPLIGAPMSIFYLKEKATISVVIGTLLAFVGVVLVILVL
ncbi:MAG: DMT family transporter [Candidatus Thorarchaeota archaeon]